MIRATICAIAVTVFVSTAYGVDIPVKNPSFEALDLGVGEDTFNEGITPPVLDWSPTSLENGGVLGTVEMNGNFPDFGGQDHGASDGDNALFISTADTVSQMLTDMSNNPIPVVSDETYTLTVDVSGRLEFPLFPFEIRLLFAGTPVATGTDADVTVPDYPNRAWVPLSIEYDARLQDAGKDMTIEIAAVGSGAQTVFDNVRLTRTPEPASLMTLLIAGLPLLSRRRD
jgi:hypothetical protein